MKTDSVGRPSAGRRRSGRMKVKVEKDDNPREEQEGNKEGEEGFKLDMGRVAGAAQRSAWRAGRRARARMGHGA